MELYVFGIYPHPSCQMSLACSIQRQGEPQTDEIKKLITVSVTARKLSVGYGTAHRDAEFKVVTWWYRNGFPVVSRSKHLLYHTIVFRNGQ